MDVCLVLEGTYPYVTGGVSAWVHNLIKALPRIRFSLLTILPTGEVYRDYKYELPENVVSVDKLFIHERVLNTDKKRGSRKKLYDLLFEFHRGIRQRDYSLLPELFRRVINPQTRVISPHELFYGKRTWEMLVRTYREREIKDSFVDYFWTWRYAHLPLLRLFNAKIPEASVYHTISTGYAGLLAGFAHLRNRAPVILTEHGIYTNERRIEIEQAQWIHEEKTESTVVTETQSPFKKMWIDLFDHLSRITYRYSDEVITLFENNRVMEVMGGADPERTRIIPNGINLTKFLIKKDYRKSSENFQVGFIGRVVPIKDVKSFIRACNIVRKKLPNCKFPVIGPFDEDQEYFEECKTMVQMLGLTEHMEFMGRQNVIELYPRMDVVVLTSVSEAQPLVILEANCCRVPCVATDVGACTELLFGRTAEDRALGPSGLVTPIADPEKTADAIITILSNPSLREAMGNAGQRRVEKYYSEEELNFAYLELYRKHIKLSETRKENLPVKTVQRSGARVWRE